ncbi:MAG: lipoyl synthase [Deltaproteobacteria bacterium RIFCSPHIGHO2_12_FULL_43_9]|nr:MAG: lipoyl synthase [Deltaproteobacteria bacterium RIFCSPHIGHO2_12_FULL_43_9]
MKIKHNGSENISWLADVMRSKNLHTVCEEAHCPNLSECWAHKTATFMIMGEICTRHCGFCAVKKGAPLPLDTAEPLHVAEVVKQMGLKHAVVTSVNRDELPDGGAAHFAKVIREIRRLNTECRIEVLIPDFCGNKEALQIILEGMPDILNHNIETVPHLYKRVRPDARYQQSLELIQKASRWSKGKPMLTKSGLMVGLGETKDMLEETFRDLRHMGCDILTIGQYLRPTPKHLPIEKYYHPDEFMELKTIALGLGFRHVESGPFVRSSYHAHEQTISAIEKGGER